MLVGWRLEHKSQLATRSSQLAARSFPQAHGRAARGHLVKKLMIRRLHNVCAANNVANVTNVRLRNRPSTRRCGSGSGSIAFPAPLALNRRCWLRPRSRQRTRPRTTPPATRVPLQPSPRAQTCLNVSFRRTAPGSRLPRSCSRAQPPTLRRPPPTTAAHGTRAHHLRRHRIAMAMTNRPCQSERGGGPEDARRQRIGVAKRGKRAGIRPQEA